MTSPHPVQQRAGRSATPRQQTLFAQLSAEVQAQGLMRRRYGLYWTKLVGVVAVLAALMTTLVLLGETWWQLAVAAALAVAFTQCAFLGHDAAHRQIFVSARWNEGTALLLSGLAGISYGWWQNKHSRHHANPNTEGKDPDIVSGVLAFTPAVVAGLRGARRWFAGRQGWAFFPLLPLEGLNLHAQGVKHVLSRRRVERRWVEASLQAVRLGGYVALVLWVMSPGKALAFLAVQIGLFGLYMGASFAPNHKGMAIIPPGTTIDFLRRQVLTSRNIRGGRVVAAAMGGLNYQVEHHLFPSMPRVSLRRAQPVVQAFCARHDVPYTQTGLLTSYGMVVRYLNRVGLGDRDPFQCPLSQQLRPRTTVG
jgi:fatty acid desaturase